MKRISFALSSRVIMTSLYSATILFFCIFISSCNSKSTKAKTPTSSNTSPAQTSWTGIKQLGVIGGELPPASIAHDSAGNIYIAGVVYGDTGLDGLALTGYHDLHFTKYNSAGEKQWSKKFGIAGTVIDIYQNSILVDSSDNVYLLFTSDTSFDSSVPRIGSTYNGYVQKFNSSGVRQWVKNYSPPTGGAMVVGGVITSTDDLVITGWVDSGSFTGGICGVMDSFVLKISKTDGSKIWAQQFTNPYGAATVNMVTRDSNDNIFIGGSKDGNGSGANTWIKKLNSSGVGVWENIQGATGAYISIISLTTDLNGNVYSVGSGEASTWGGITLLGAGDAFIMKVSSSGNTHWIKTLGNNISTHMSASSIVNDGKNMYIAGASDGPFVGFSPLGSSDAFIAKYSLLDGSKKWIRQIGESGVGVGGGILDIRYDAEKSDYSLFIAGTTSETLNGSPLIGDYDLFIAKFNSSGTRY